MTASLSPLRPCASEAHSGHSSLGLDGSSASAGVAVPFEDRLLIVALLGLAALALVGFCATLAGV